MKKKALLHQLQPSCSLNINAITNFTNAVQPIVILLRQIHEVVVLMKQAVHPMYMFPLQDDW